jgi:O-antigen ligase
MQLWFVGLVLFFATYTQVMGGSFNGRLRGVGGSFDSNDMASIMAMAFPMAAGLMARSAPGRARLIAIAATVALVLCVIATGSRGGTLALLAGVIVFALGLRGERGVMMFMALILGGVLTWTTAPQSFRDRMVSLTNLENDYNYTHDTGRKAVWKRGRQYWRENFVVGVGAGNFPMAEGLGWSERGDTGKWSAAHNAYVQVFAELGTIGGSIFVLVLLGAAKGALPFWRGRAPGQQRGPPMHRPEYLASLAGFAAGGYFLSHAYFMPQFAVLGIIALADRVRIAEAATLPAAARGIAVPVAVRRPGVRGGAAAMLVQPPAAFSRGGLGLPRAQS